MRRSEDRILTTHTGSLPRPAELTRLYVRRARGELVDAAEIDRLGKAALRGIVTKQAEAGVDVGNNGEQQREGFFLHIRHRMSGFGGSWQRRPRADALRYPVFKQMMEQQLAAREAVSNMGPPKAIGEVRYLGRAAIEAEIADFRAALDRDRHAFVEPFLTAPSPGIIAGAMKNEYYDSEEAYLAALGAALREEYEAIVGAGFLLQLDCPDLALERHLSYPGPAARRLSRLCRAGGRDDQQGARQHPARQGPPACLLGQLRGAARLRRAARRHPADPPERPMSAAFSCRSPTRATRTNTSLREIAAGRRPDHHRRRDRQPDQFRRAPRGGRRPARARRARRSATRTASSPAPIAASTPRPGWAASPRTSSGPSSRRWPIGARLASERLRMA